MFQINGSIVRHKNKLYCSYRRDHIHNFDSKSYLTELDESLNILSGRKLIPLNRNTAFEDIRLISFGEVLYCFYNYLPYFKNHGWSPNYLTGFGIVDCSTGIIRDQFSFIVMTSRRVEKNWIPYIYDDTLYVVSDFDPYLRIISIGKCYENYSIKEVYFSQNETISWKYGEIRGGTPLIPCLADNSKWLYGFVHSHLPNHNGYKRYYFFTVARFNHEDKIFEYYPVPLSLDEIEIDEEHILLWRKSNNETSKVIFPIGITDFESGVLVSFGIDDVYTYTKYYDWEYILGLFN